MVQAYYDAARSAGHEVRMGEKVTINRDCYIADTDRQARVDVEEHCKTFWRTAGPSIGRALPPELTIGHEEGGFEPSWETMLKINLIAGDSSHCLEQFHQLKEETQIENVWLNVDMTNLSQEKAMNNIRNIGKILPDIKSL
jgi:alkanesulfonate monooxygenase SsuD/methylene tetrahydromethanopterin reductase-like flavin-dependent oxidoreductase (luciferase family)